MQITLTEKQLEKLIKTTFIGKFVVENSQNPNDPDKDLEDLFTKLLKTWRENNLKSLSIEKNNQLQASQKLEFDEYVSEHIQKYNQKVFLEELISALIERDIKQNHNDEQIQNMDMDEFFEIEKKHYNKRKDEIYKNWIKNFAFQWDL